jgi:hypothetical protein
MFYYLMLKIFLDEDVVWILKNINDQDCYMRSRNISFDLDY